MNRLRTLGLLYSLLLLALLPIHYVLWVLPGEELMERKYRALVAIALLVCLATSILAGSLTPRTSDGLLRQLTLYLATRKYRLGLILILVAVLWPCVTADVVLDRFINSGDEFAYVFQARRLLEGRFWYEAPRLATPSLPCGPGSLGINGSANTRQAGLCCLPQASVPGCRRGP